MHACCVTHEVESLSKNEPYLCSEIHGYTELSPTTVIQDTCSWNCQPDAIRLQVGSKTLLQAASDNSVHVSIVSTAETSWPHDKHKPEKHCGIYVLKVDLAQAPRMYCKPEVRAYHELALWWEHRRRWYDSMNSWKMAWNRPRKNLKIFCHCYVVAVSRFPARLSYSRKRDQFLLTCAARRCFPRETKCIFPGRCRKDVARAYYIARVCWPLRKPEKEYIDTALPCLLPAYRTKISKCAFPDWSQIVTHQNTIFLLNGKQLRKHFISGSCSAFFSQNRASSVIN